MPVARLLGLAATALALTGHVHVAQTGTWVHETVEGDALSRDPWRVHPYRFVVLEVAVVSPGGAAVNHPRADVAFDFDAGVATFAANASHHALIVVHDGSATDAYLLWGPGTIARFDVDGKPPMTKTVYLLVGPNATGPDSTRPHVMFLEDCPASYEDRTGRTEGPDGVGVFGLLAPQETAVAEVRAPCDTTTFRVTHHGIWTRTPTGAARTPAG